jgi:hypothetical protein
VERTVYYNRDRRHSSVGYRAHASYVATLRLWPKDHNSDGVKPFRNRGAALLMSGPDKVKEEERNLNSGALATRTGYQPSPGTGRLRQVLDDARNRFHPLHGT